MATNFVAETVERQLPFDATTVHDPCNADWALFMIRLFFCVVVNIDLFLYHSYFSVLDEDAATREKIAHTKKISAETIVG